MGDLVSNHHGRDRVVEVDAVADDDGPDWGQVLADAVPVWVDVAPVWVDVAPVLVDVAPVWEDVAPVWADVVPVWEDVVPDAAVVALVAVPDVAVVALDAETRRLLHLEQDQGDHQIPVSAGFEILPENRLVPLRARVEPRENPLVRLTYATPTLITLFCN